MRIIYFYNTLFLLLVLPALPLYAEYDEYLTMEGQGITVTGTRESTQEIKTISRDEIERIAAPDLPTLLEESLHLTTTKYGAEGAQTYINVRGFDSQRVAVLIDGVPVNTALTGEFDFNSLDMSAIEKIEVVYGGSDTKYNVSGALGGVINIITKKKAEAGWKFGAGFSNTSYIPQKYREWVSGENKSPDFIDLLDSQNMDFNTSYGGKTFSLRGNLYSNRAGNHFYYKDAIKKTRRKTGGEFWNLGGDFALIYELPNLSRIITGADISYNDFNIPTSGYSTIYNKQKDFTVRNNISFEAPAIFSDNISMEATLSNRWIDDSFDTARNLADDIQLINRWSFFPVKILTLRAGWDYRYNYYDSQTIGLRDRHDFGLYLTSEFSPVKKFMLVASVKLISDTNIYEPVPKLGWVWYAIDGTLTFKNNYFRSFKLPDFEDMYYNSGGYYGNPDLKPEDGWGGDLGGEFNYRDFSLAGTFFAQYTVDSIHWSSSAGTWRPENIPGGAWMFGLDSSASYTWQPGRFIFKKIIFSASYQYLRSYLLSYGYTWSDNKRIPYQPEHTAGGSADMRWDTGSLLLSAHFESTRFSDSANLSPLKPHCLLTVNISQDIGKSLRAFAIVRNALNWSYESFSGYPMPGASLTLGVRFNMDIKEQTGGGAD